MQTRRETSRLGQPLCACSGSNVFAGYASVFNRRDRSGDIVEPGAFAETLKRSGPQGVRMLFQHDPAEPVGTWLDLRETRHGLYVEGRLDRNVQRGRELASLIELRGLDGLSIGFRTLRARTDPAARARRLLQVELWEISLVTFPMQEGARVNAMARRAAAERLFARPQTPPPTLAALLRDGARLFNQE